MLGTTSVRVKFSGDHPNAPEPRSLPDFDQLRYLTENNRAPLGDFCNSIPVTAAKLHNRREKQFGPHPDMATGLLLANLWEDIGQEWQGRFISAEVGTSPQCGGVNHSQILGRLNETD
jgi:hypothetical protein